MRRYWSLVGLVMLAAATPTQPTQCVPQQPTAVNLPVGWVAYKTDRPITPYELAKRAYGEGWQEGRIRAANRLKLVNKVFPAGTEILIPPDLKGHAVLLDRLMRNPY
jgi:hypothetical protein